MLSESEASVALEFRVADLDFSQLRVFYDFSSELPLEHT